MTHLSHKDVETWAGQAGPGRYLVCLQPGDRMAIRYHPQGMGFTAAGPAIVEIVVFRDGDWTARELPYETPESIAPRTEYQATHTDVLTREIRASGWSPKAEYVCGCEPSHLCAGHATIRAAEHYHPELAR